MFESGVERPNWKGMPPQEWKSCSVGQTPTCDEQVQNVGNHGIMGLLYSLESYFSDGQLLCFER